MLFIFLQPLGKVGMLQVEQMEEASAVGGSKLANLTMALATGNMLDGLEAGAG